MVDESRQRIRQATEERRQELGLSQEALAAASEVSLSTVSRLERGNYVSPPMKRRIERALGWKKGSIDAVRDGGEPTLAEVPPPRTGGAQAGPGVQSLAAEIEYFRALLGAEDFHRLFQLIDALYHERRRRESSNPDTTQGDQLEDTG